VSVRAFDVDLAGLLRVFGGHLYSTPDVFVRELVQNALDAQVMLSSGRGRPTVRIRVDSAAGSVSFEDQGVGLDRDGLRAQLSRIGSSSKRGGDVEGVIGQFGIGLLSGFLVADRLVVETKTADGEPLRWDASVSGEYRIEPGARESRGTSVTVYLREADRRYADATVLRRILERHVLYVDASIELIADGDAETLTATPPWLRDLDELAAELGEADGHEPLALRRFQHGRSRGVLWLRGVESSRAATCAAYIHGMLVDESERSLLPQWASFCGAAIDAVDLSPTASREAFVRDSAWRALCEALERELIAWLLALADSEAFATLMRQHHRALGAACLEQPALLEALAGQLPFATNLGTRTLDKLAIDGRIHYAIRRDDFARLAPLLTARGELLVNACHVHEPELLAAWKRSRPALQLEPMSFERLGEFAQPAEEHGARFGALLEAATALLGAYDVRIELCRFAPSEVPVLVLADESRLRERARKLSGSGTPLQRALVAELLAVRQAVYTPMLVNVDNPLISALPELGSVSRGARVLRMLYFQAVAHAREVPSLVEAREFAADFLAVLRDGSQSDRGPDPLSN
jgi:molecular chaperone HtpG